MTTPQTNAYGFPEWEKDPQAVKDYAINYTEWLGTDTIQTSTWTIPSGLTKTTDSHDNTHAVVWLSGGTAGTRYHVSNKITTVGGRTEVRSIDILVKNQ